MVGERFFSAGVALISSGTGTFSVDVSDLMIIIHLLPVSEPRKSYKHHLTAIQTCRLLIQTMDGY